MGDLGLTCMRSSNHIGMSTVAVLHLMVAVTLSLACFPEPLPPQWWSGMVLLHFHPCDVTKDPGMGGAKLHPFSITQEYTDIGLMTRCMLHVVWDGAYSYIYTCKHLLHNIAQGPDPPIPSSSIIGQGLTCRLLMGCMGCAWLINFTKRINFRMKCKHNLFTCTCSYSIAIDLVFIKLLFIMLSFPDK